MRQFVRLFVVASVTSACIDLKLPDLPGPPGPGSVTGRAVMFPPGRTVSVPVRGARVELLGTGLFTTTDATGYFRIDGVVRESKQVLFRADLDGDGNPDRSKLLTLDAARVGLGKNVSLGDVVLVENATVTGQVLLEDVTTPTGHAGTLIFLPEGPYTATTSDDGRFIFSDLPEGTISVAFFRAGYRARSLDAVTLSSGQELNLTTITLRRETVAIEPVTITGKVRLPAGGPAPEASVTLSTSLERRVVLTGPDGQYEATGLTGGLFAVVAEKEGFLPARISNVVAISGRIELFDITLNAVPSGTGGGTAGGFNTDVGGGSAGGGSASVGGGTAGGSASVGGGAAGGASVGGGTAGGSASVGGGTAGGSASVGGGTSGGSASVGGGAAGGSVSVGGGTAGGSGSVGGGSAGGSAPVGGGTAGGSASVGGGTAGGSVSVGGGSAGGSTTTVPARPTNLTASAGDQQVAITFTATPGATSHRLYWSNQPNVSRTNGTLFGTVTSPTLHQGLTNGITTYYVVTAVNAVGESVESNVASAIPSATASQLNPHVLARRPDVGATAVRVGSRITVRFDRDLNGATAVPANVELALLSGGVVPTTIASAGPTLTITPASPLSFETTYRVTLGVGLRDSMNRPLEQPDTWAFTTGSPAPAMTAHVGDYAVTLTWNELPGALYSILTRTRGTNVTSLGTITGTTFTDTSTPNGLLHSYSVSTVTPFGLSAPSADVLATPQPSRPQPPGSLVVTAGRTNALLQWSAVSGATGYSIYRASRERGPATRIASAFQSTTFLDTNLPTDQVVSYSVQTEALNGTSVWSVPATARPDSARLAAPADAEATPGNGWVRLTWSPTPLATRYVVYRALWPNGTPNQLAIVNQGTRFDDLSASVGSTYRYFIAAVGNALVGDFSEVSASPIPGLRPPPFRLQSPSIEVNRVQLGAQSNPLGATLEVFRSTSIDGGFVPVATSDNTVDGGTRYFYIGRHRDGTELSDFTPPVEITPAPSVIPAAPTNVVVLPASAGVNVTFTAVPNATGYQVGFASAPGGTPTARSFSYEPHDTIVLTPTTDNLIAYLSVRAVNGSTLGPWSAEQAVRSTNIGNLAGLASANVTVREGDRHLTVSWPVVPSAAEYRVYRRTRTTPYALLSTTPQLWVQDSAVTNDVEYRYAVIAQNLAPPNTRYSQVQFSSWSEPSASRPPRVTGLTATPTSGGALVRWNPIGGADQYVVTAAFNSGGAPSNIEAQCNTYDPYDTSCQLSLSSGTQYVIAISAYGPNLNGSGAWSEEVPISPNPLAPPAPAAVTTEPGSDRQTVRANLVANTTYRLWRRGRNSPDELLGTFPTPFFSDSQPNGLAFAYDLQAVTSQGSSPLGSIGFTAPSSLAPPAPTLLSIAPGNTLATLEWVPVIGASGYNFSVADTVDGPFAEQTSQTGTYRSTATLANQLNGETRWWVVRATGPNGVSAGAPSQPLSVTPNTMVLGRPTLSITNGNQAVQLSWPTIAGATGYQLQRRSDDSPWQPLVALSTRRYVDRNVENGERWYYQVRAMSPTETGIWSAESAVQDVLATIPIEPPGFTVRPSQNGAFVEWTPSPGATGYAVFSDSVADGAFNTNHCNPSDLWETRCRITLSSAAWVVVRASAPGVVSITTQPLSVAPNPTLPGLTSVSATAMGTGALRVSWNAVSGATGYRVYRRVVNGAPVEVTQTTMTSFTNSGLTSGQQYIFYVEAENAVGRGAWSSGTTALAAP